MGRISGSIPGVGGIYEIVDGSGWRYVGSSADMNKRWASHKSALRGGKHHSPSLQLAYSRDGESAFRFNVLEVVYNESQLVSREQYWMDKLRPQHNVAAHAGRSVSKRPRSKSTEYGNSNDAGSVSHILFRRICDMCDGLTNLAYGRADATSDRVQKELALLIITAAYFVRELAQEKRDDYLFLSRLESSTQFQFLKREYDAMLRRAA